MRTIAPVSAASADSISVTTLDHASDNTSPELPGVDLVDFDALRSPDGLYFSFISEAYDIVGFRLI